MPANALNCAESKGQHPEDTRQAKSAIDWDLAPTMKKPRLDNQRFSDICKQSSSMQRVAGGDTCQAFHLPGAPGGPLFLKMRKDAPPNFFACEARGLAAIAATKTIRVPEVVAGGKDFLLLEFIPLGAMDTSCWLACADALARLHSCSAPHFGFHEDNYCGATPQPNPSCEDGYEFFARARLGHQATLAAARGLLTAGEEAAVHRIGEHLAEWIPVQPPSLLHGDLWAGNICAAQNGTPVLVDPAAHWGWGEVDLAMMELFAAPNRFFLDCYREHRPQAPGWEERVPLYNLYHLLNHLNLFGQQWHSSVLSILQRFA